MPETAVIPIAITVLAIERENWVGQARELDVQQSAADTGP